MNRRQALLSLAALGIPSAAALVGLGRREALRALAPAGHPSGPAPTLPLPSYREGPSLALGTRDLRALAVGPDGRAWVALERRLLGFDARGTPVEGLPLGAPATAVAAGPEGELWVAARSRLRLLGRDGWEADLGENAWVTSVAPGQEHVYAADAGNRVVWRFDRRGRLRGLVGGSAASSEGFVVPSPYFDVALRSSLSGEELWVANPGRHRVERRSGEGVLRGGWGVPSPDAGGFDGCCNPSHLAVLPAGGFLTSDKGRPRVRVWDADGRLRALVAGPEAWSPGTRWVEAAPAPDGAVLVLDPGAGALRRFLPPPERGPA